MPDINAVKEAAMYLSLPPEVAAALEEYYTLKEQTTVLGFAIDANKARPVTHIKTGNNYLLLLDEHVKIESTWADGVLYIDTAGEHLIVRDKEEFYDGRFKEETETDASRRDT